MVATLLDGVVRKSLSEEVALGQGKGSLRRREGEKASIMWSRELMPCWESSREHMTCWKSSRECMACWENSRTSCCEGVFVRVPEVILRGSTVKQGIELVGTRCSEVGECGVAFRAHKLLIQTRPS